MRPHSGHDSSSKCCCCMHIRIGTYIVAALEFIGLLIATICVIYFFDKGFQGSASRYHFTNPPFHSVSMSKKIQVGNAAISLAGGVIAFLIGTGAIISLLIGLIKTRPRLVLIHLIVQIIAVVSLLIALMIYALYASNNIAATEEELTPNIDNGVPLEEDLIAMKKIILEGRRFFAIIACVFFGVAFVIEAFFLSVGYRCYKFVKGQSDSC